MLKYPVISVTGVNKMVILASSKVTHVRRSTEKDSLMAMRLKFIMTSESFCARHSSISLKAYNMIRSLRRSKRTLAAELSETPRRLSASGIMGPVVVLGMGTSDAKDSAPDMM